MLYFNYAGLSPTNAEVLEDIRRTNTEFSTVLFSEAGVAWYRSKVRQCRLRVAELLGLDPDVEHIRFVPNATTAYRLFLSYLEFAPGDVVIASDQEHPSIARAMCRLRHNGVELRRLKADSEEALCEGLKRFCQDGRVRLITFSHVAYTDGRTLPVRQICEIARDTNAIVALDGAQAVGQIPVDVGAAGPDCYFFSGHKWCAGPMGTGALIITRTFLERSPSIQQELLEVGSPEKYFDFGTQAIGLIAGFAKACAIQSNQRDTVAKLERLRSLLSEELSDLKEAELLEWNGPHAPGILSLRVLKPHLSVDGIVTHLFERYGIALKPPTAPEERQLIRISWSGETNPDDIRWMSEKLKSTIRGLQ
ncbi:aminotransferase class V-fold PLP-dependent enzyme [Candidatus Nitrospira bockiana]